MYFGDSGGTGWWAAEEVVENGEMVDGDGRRALHVTDAGMVVGAVARREEVEHESTPLSDGRGRWGGIVGCVVYGSVPGREDGLGGDRQNWQIGRASCRERVSR